MAFQAGAIESRMTLDRSAFTAGLKLARQQARRFEDRTIKARMALESTQASRTLESFRRRQSNRDINIPVEIQSGKLSKQLERVAQATEKTASRSGSRLARLLLNPTIAALGTLPGVAAVSAAGVTASLSVAGAAFGGLAVAAHQSNEEITSTFAALESSVLSRIRSMTSSAIPEITQVAVQAENALDRVDQNLEAAFAGSGRQINLFTDAVLSLGEEALPGVSVAAVRSSTALEGLDSLTTQTGQGLSNFFRIVSTRSDEAASGMESLGSLVNSTLTTTGRLAAQFTDTWDQVGPEFVSMVERMLSVTTEFTEGALPALGDVLEVTFEALERVASVVEPLSAGFGGFAGTLLGVAASMRVVNGLVNRLTQSVPGASMAVGSLNDRMRRSTQSTSRFRRGLGRTANTLGRMARAAPFVGAAVIGVKTAFDNAVGSADEMAQKLLQGGTAADEARDKISEHSASLTEASLAQKLWGANMDESRARMQELRQGMSPLERAKSDVTRATNDLSDATNDWGKNSPPAREAAQRLASATDRLEQEQLQAKLATMGHTEQVVRQRRIMLGAISSQLGYEGSMIQVRQQQQRLNELTDEGKTDTLEYEQTLNGLQQTMVGSVEQFVKARVEKAKSNNVTDLATVKQRAQTFALANLAVTAGENVPPQLQKMINKTDDSAFAALGATTETDKLGNTVVNLPDGKELTFPNNADAASGDVESLSQSINSVPSSKTTNFLLNYTRSISGPAPEQDPGLPLPNFGLGGGAQGIINRFAQGGKLTPMSAGTAARIPPNSWRIIGDRAYDDEAYIPINKSSRSRKLLHETARDMGYSVQPMANGGILGTSTASGMEGQSLAAKLDRIARLLEEQQPLSFNIGQASPETVHEFADKVMVRLRHSRKRTGSP